MTQPRRSGGDAGFALASILVMLASMSLMIAGLFLLALSEQRMGEASIALLRARLAAEAGLASIGGSWDGGDSPYPAVSDRTTGAVGDAVFEVSRLVLGPRFSLVESVGFGPLRRARHVVGEIWENRRWEITITAGVTLEEGTPPESWIDLSTRAPGEAEADCPPNGVPAGPVTVRVEPDGVIPRGPDLDYLQGTAEIRLTGGTVAFASPSYRADGLCDTGDPANWGDPTGAGGDCTGYFPFVYSTGNLRIIGGVAQGIIFVEGDLELAGGFEFSGLLLVAGRLTTRPSGARVVGAIVAGTMDFDDFSARDLSAITYSACAVEKALESHPVPRPLPQRGRVGSI